MEKVRKCSICHKSFNSSELVSGELVNEYLTKLIRASCEDWNEKSLICKPDLNRFRTQYVREALKQDLGEITELENDVLRSLTEHELISDNLNKKFEQDRTTGDRWADRIAEFGGSWGFIFIFGGVLIGWIVVNSISLFRTHYDPYPYILLNLVLSTLAALQAPIIMMSQNRQQAKDRLQSELDYKVNLKAELEIRHLKAKVDQLATHQWQRLLEIQELQTELIADLARSKPPLSK
jgi:uncharacterized membrane protein